MFIVKVFSKAGLFHLTIDSDFQSLSFNVPIKKQDWLTIRVMACFHCNREMLTAIHLTLGFVIFIILMCHAKSFTRTESLTPCLYT